MFRIRAPMITTTALCAAAGVALGLAVFLIAGAIKAQAEPQIQVAVHDTLAKSDRLLVPTKGSACSSHGWPHFEQSCLFDMRRPTDAIRKVRVIALR